MSFANLQSSQMLGQLSACCPLIKVCMQLESLGAMRNEQAALQQQHIMQSHRLSELKVQDDRCVISPSLEQSFCLLQQSCNTPQCNDEAPPALLRPLMAVSQSSTLAIVFSQLIMHLQPSLHALGLL